MAFSVRVLQVGHQKVRGPIIFYLDRFDAWEPFIDTMVVVRGEGKTVVINSGLPKDLAILEPFWPSWPGERKWEVSEEEKPLNALRKIGVEPSTVDVLIISPLVFYATGNIDLFPNAQLCILRKGWTDFHAPSHGYYDSIRSILIPYEILTHMVTDAWPRVRLLDDEEEILPGLRTFFAGVHHRSSMGVCIETQKGTAVFSDCFFKFRNMEENIPIGAVENIEEAYHSYQRIRRQAKLLIPMFDPELFERYPGGVVA